MKGFLMSNYDASLDHWPVLSSQFPIRKLPQQAPESISEDKLLGTRSLATSLENWLASFPHGNPDTSNKLPIKGLLTDNFMFISALSAVWREC
jgi:hypothetical protein